MKSLFFTEEHQQFRSMVGKFMEKEIAPFANQWEADRAIPREIWKKMAANELLGVPHPAAYGGSEADFFYSVVFLEELSRSGLAGFAAAVGVHVYIALAYIAEFGSEALKEAYLRPGIAGEKIGALAVTEPDAGSDVAAIRTRAKREGDIYIIDGAKTFITNGYYGDFIVVAAKTETAEGAGGISLFVVDRNAEGVSARKLDKVGWHCSDTAELSFDGVKTPAANLLGEENMGFYYIMQCFQLERLMAAITSVAGANFTLEHTLQYIKERQAFGRPLAKFQVLRHNLADLATEIEAARQLTYQAAYQYDQKEEAVKLCSMAKLYASEVAKKTTDVCLQCFGGYGYMDDYPISRFYRDARAGTIVGGTSEIMREIIAKMVIDQVSYSPPGQSKSAPQAEAPVRKSENQASPGAPAAEPPTAAATPISKAGNPTAREVVFDLPNRFRPDKAGDYRGTIHFIIKGEGGGEFTVEVGEGLCRVQEGLHGDAVCRVQTSAKTYLDIETGRTNPQVAFMMGRVKVTNVTELINFTRMFDKMPDT